MRKFLANLVMLLALAAQIVIPASVQAGGSRYLTRVAFGGGTVGPKIISAPPAIAVGTPVLWTPSIVGGLGGYSCSISSLPPGLTFSASTCTVSGTPTVASAFTLTAADRGGSIASQTASPNPYILDANYGGGIWSFAGASYASEAEFLTASGGTGSTGKVVFGPFVSSSAPELVPNGPVADASGWSVAQVSGGPATGTAVGGEYQLSTSVAANRPFGYSAFPVQSGKAYVASAKVRKDAAASTNAKFSLSNDVSQTLGPVAGSALVGATTLTAVPARSFAPMTGVTTMFAGVLGQSSSFTGLLAIDDLTVKEAVPLSGWTAGGISGVVEAVTPGALPTVDAVIWQADDGAQDGSTAQERNYVRLAYDSAGRLRLKVFAQTVLGSTGTQQANIDLGAVATSTPFKVHFVVTSGIAGASLNDAAALTASPTAMPGIAVMRWRQSQVASTNDFAGTLTRVRLFRELTAPAGMTLAIIPMNGDSYGSGFGAYLAAATGAAIDNVSVGGSNIDQEIGYRLGKPLAPPVLANIFWDGDSNGMISVADYLSKVDQIIALSGGPTRILMLPPLKRPSTTSDNANRDLIQAGMSARLGANYIDAQAILATLGDGSTADNAAIAAGYAPPSVFSDGVHLKPAPFQAVAAAAAVRWTAIN